MRVECKRYKATIPEKTCVSRVKKTMSRQGFDPGDPGCVRCEQGRKLYEKYQKEGEPIMARKKCAPAIFRINKDGKEEKRCSSCKRYYPATAEYSYKDARAKSNLTSLCRVCQTAKNNSKPLSVRSKKTESDKRGSGENPGTLVLDFSKHPHLLDKIKTAAVEEVRSTADQAIWWLKNCEELS